jgi:hypothetical protein
VASSSLLPNKELSRRAEEPYQCCGSHGLDHPCYPIGCNEGLGKISTSEVSSKISEVRDIRILG